MHRCVVLTCIALWLCDFRLMSSAKLRSSTFPVKVHCYTSWLLLIGWCGKVAAPAHPFVAGCGDAAPSTSVSTKFFWPTLAIGVCWPSSHIPFVEFYLFQSRRVLYQSSKDRHTKPPAQLDSASLLQVCLCCSILTSCLATGFLCLN